MSRSPLGHQLLYQSPGRAVLCRFYRDTAKITSEPGASFVLPLGAQVGRHPVYCLRVSLCVLPAGLDDKLCKNSVRIISPCFLLSVKCITKSWRDGKETVFDRPWSERCIRLQAKSTWKLSVAVICFLKGC